MVAFTGFYEWKRDDKGERQPYYFHYADDRPLLVRTVSAGDFSWIFLQEILRAVLWIAG